MRRALVAVVLATMLGCETAKPRTHRPNVLLIMIDTLRADRVGVYGNRRGLTPFLDELAARGHVMRQARAQAPWTNPSIASIFTSRYPSQHGVIDYASMLPAEELTLAEILQADGYVTGAFSANGLIGASLGFAQGFDRFDAHLMMEGSDARYLRLPPRTDRMAADALAWVDTVRRENRPMFLYVHLMEPHSPYAPPQAALARVRGDRPPIDLIAASTAMAVGMTIPVSPDELQAIEDAYDASVLALDEALRTFFAALAARGFLDDAIVVVTADHGEEFQEHGARGHARALFDESIHVPMLVLAPGTSPGVVEHVVSSVDIAPTILELAGVAAPPRFAGTSFASDLTPSAWERLRRRLGWPGRAASDRAAYSELVELPGGEVSKDSTHHRAMVVDQMKLIETRDGTRRFYDLRLDATEQAPNIVEDPQRAQLERQLAEHEALAARDPSPRRRYTPDERLREHLKALGYAQ